MNEYLLIWVTFAGLLLETMGSPCWGHLSFHLGRSRRVTPSTVPLAKGSFNRGLRGRSENFLPRRFLWKETRQRS